MKDLTLKQFFELNNIKATMQQRGKVGRKLTPIFEPTKPMIEEDGYMVRIYPEDFLNNDNTILLIIETLQKL